MTELDEMRSTVSSLNDYDLEKELAFAVSFGDTGHENAVVWLALLRAESDKRKVSAEEDSDSPWDDANKDGLTFDSQTFGEEE